MSERCDAQEKTTRGQVKDAQPCGDRQGGRRRGKAGCPLDHNPEAPENSLGGIWEWGWSECKCPCSSKDGS
jgi:hypothetical protein